MEPFTIAGILLLKYAASHGIFATAAAGAATLAVAAVVYIAYLTFSTVLTWFRDTRNDIRSRQKSNINLKAITTAIGKISQPTKTINVGLGDEFELMTGRNSNYYQEKYIVQLIKDSLTDEVIETKIIKFDDLDQELLDVHHSDAIVIWT